MQFVGIGSNDGAAAIRSFVDRHGVGVFPHASDPSGKLRADLGVVGQPTWWFVDGGDGNIDKVYGELGQKGLTDRVEALVRG